MVTGQKVTIKVDNTLTMIFNGTVTSFSPATVALLYFASDNATGNFVKTIRLPVKISLDTIIMMLKKIKLLRPGNECG
jgi:membrane fusion protein (multidrug efflux system)